MNERNTESIQRVTANLPEKLLKEALKTTRAGITETLVEGLRLIRRRQAYAKAMALKGKINLKINLTQSRERTYR